jgi:hypothetical protein
MESKHGAVTILPITAADQERVQELFTGSMKRQRYERGLYQRNKDGLYYRLTAYFKGRTPVGREYQRLSHLIHKAGPEARLPLQLERAQLQTFATWRKTEEGIATLEWLTNNPRLPKLTGYEGAKRYSKMRDWWLSHTVDGKNYARLRRLLSMRRKLKQGDGDFPARLKALTQFSAYRISPEGIAELKAQFPEYFT